MTKRHPNVEPAHPGDILREDVVPALGISVGAFAKALGVSRHRLHKVLKRERSVTAELAVKLEHVVGSSAETWLGMQVNHDLFHARRVIDVSRPRKLNRRVCP